MRLRGASGCLQVNAVNVFEDVSLLREGPAAVYTREVSGAGVDSLVLLSEPSRVRKAGIVAGHHADVRQYLEMHDDVVSLVVVLAHKPYAALVEREAARGRLLLQLRL